MSNEAAAKIRQRVKQSQEQEVQRIGHEELQKVKYLKSKERIKN